MAEKHHITIESCIICQKRVSVFIPLGKNSVLRGATLEAGFPTIVGSELGFNALRSDESRCVAFKFDRLTLSNVSPRIKTW